MKLNRSSLLAMDDETRANVNKVLIDSRVKTPSEVRAKEDLEPLTQEQIAEFDVVFGNPNKQTPQKGQA